MAEYQFCLRTPGASCAAWELIDAMDDDEARSLAEIRLLLTGDVATVTVFRSGVEMLHVERDRPRGQAIGSRPAPPDSGRGPVAEGLQ